MLAKTFLPIYLSLLILLTMLIPGWSATATATNTMEAYLRTGYQQLLYGQNDEAVATFSYLVANNPNNINARRYLAIALTRTGAAQNALEQIQVVIKLSPGIASDQTVLGDAYFYLGDARSAIQCYKRALAMDSTLDNAKVGLVNSYLNQGQPEQASLICVQAIRMSKDISSRERFEDLLQQIQSQSVVEHKNSNS